MADRHTAVREYGSGPSQGSLTYASAGREQPHSPDIVQAMEYEDDNLLPTSQIMEPYNVQHSHALIRHGKVFNDVVHNHFRLPPLLQKCYDTPEFQRLRNLHQLGLTHYVYPSAVHTRLEHSLGVAYLARQAALRYFAILRREGALEMGRREEERDINIIAVAGLLHDLGHGLFSHAFERGLLPRLGIEGWAHEEMSADMFRHMVEQNVHGLAEDLDEDAQRQVVDIILSAHDPNAHRAPAGKRWQYEIVANGRNGLDVDKFDYLQRDSYHTGVKIATNFERLTHFSKVIDDQICYKWNERRNVYSVFHDRASMYTQVYLHRKVKGIECLVMDALVEAEPILRIRERIRHPSTFMRLTDTVIDAIEDWDEQHPGEEASPRLRTAQALIQRLRQRQLYRFVGDFQVPEEALQRGSWRKPSPEDLVSWHSDASVPLRVEDVIVLEVKVDCTNDGDNPLERVSFYDFDDDTSIAPRRSAAANSGMLPAVHRHSAATNSGMLPAVHRERQCWVYSRNRDQRVCDALLAALKRYLDHKHQSRIVCSTPTRNPKRGAPGGDCGSPGEGWAKKPRGRLFG